ncbi:MAG: Gmad2 immunoglobulin-like domain-containing protein [Minisyncoccia bacterium]
MQPQHSKTHTILLLILVLMAGVIIGLLLSQSRNKIEKETPVVVPVQNTIQNPAPVVEKPTNISNQADLVSFSIDSGSSVHGLTQYKGTISGGYFFEGNILVNILDANKNILKKSNAVAKTEWMTSGPVDFEGSIDFTVLPKGPAYIEIHNDNASGLPENDKSILIPVIIE